MRRTVITLATAGAIAVAVAVPYLTGAEASSVHAQNAERTAVVLLDGTENVAPVSTTEAAGLVQEKDSAQAKQILQKIGAAALWSYDPSSAKFETLARKIPAAGAAIYVRPKTIQTIETIADPAVLTAASDETSDTMPVPYIHSLYRRGPRRFTWTYQPGEGWTTGGGNLVDNPPTTNSSQDLTTTNENETPVGTTTTTTTVPTTTTTVRTTTTTADPPTTTTDPPTTTSTTAPSTTTTVAPTTTSTSTTTTVAPKPTTTTTTTTIPRKKAVATTTSTTSTTSTTTTLAPTTTLPATTTTVGTGVAAPVGYSASQLEFNDPASATAINPSLWNTYITSAAAQGQPWNSNGQGGSSAAGSGDFDAEYDLPGQVTEGNGVIDLRATDTPSDGYPWTSGTISSYGKFQFDGGYLQVEAKMPAGSGMWPGIWLLPGAGAYDGDNYEIDLFEGGYNDGGAGSSYTNMFAWHLHTQGGTFGADSNTNVNLTTSFNTYGLKWIPGQSITWYLNGNVIGTVTSAQASIPNEPMELIMDLQVANGNTTQWHSQVNSSTPVNNDMLISGVQVYS